MIEAPDINPFGLRGARNDRHHLPAPSAHPPRESDWARPAQMRFAGNVCRTRSQSPPTSVCAVLPIRNHAYELARWMRQLSWSSPISFPGRVCSRCRRMMAIISGRSKGLMSWMDGMGQYVGTRVSARPSSEASEVRTSLPRSSTQHLSFRSGLRAR